MNYQNVFCFKCKTQCTDIPQSIIALSESGSVHGVKCPKCNTLYTTDGIVEGVFMTQLMKKEGIK